MDTKRPWATDGKTTDNPKDLVEVCSFDLSEHIATCNNAENASLIVKAVNNHDTLLFYAKDYLKRLEKKDPNSVTLIDGLRQAIANAEGR